MILRRSQKFQKFLQSSIEQRGSALSIPSDSDFQIHLKRKPNACFINNFFSEGLQAWQANIDIQPVFHHYKAVTYMCAYFSKADDETSEAMRQAAKEALNASKTEFETMKAIAKAYLTKRVCSVHETVYHILPELWLQKIFPKVSFLNSDMPEKQYRIFKKKCQIDELPQDSTEILKRHMLDRYLDRPDESFKNGMYRDISNMCFSQFLSLFYPKSRTKKDLENDYQPIMPDDKLLETHHKDCNYPKEIPLMSSKEKLKRRKAKAVLRYFQPSPSKAFETYAYHLYFSFYPFRNEEELKSPPVTGSYRAKLFKPGVINIINRNKATMEPFCELVDQALLSVHSDIHSHDAFSQQENDEVYEQMSSTVDSLFGNSEDPTEGAAVLDEAVYVPVYSRPSLIPDSELNSNVHELNQKQHQLFDIVYSWAKNVLKSRSLNPHTFEKIKTSTCIFNRKCWMW